MRYVTLRGQHMSILVLENISCVQRKIASVSTLAGDLRHVELRSLVQEVSKDQSIAANVVVDW
jgi:hypothetical protein